MDGEFNSGGIMVENHIEERKEYEHDGASDLYADTKAEKIGKRIWEKVKNVLKGKGEGQKREFISLSDSKVEYNNDYKDFLNNSFQREKKNSPDKAERLYFLILGVDEGILSFNEFLDKSCKSEYQSFFADSKGLKKDGRIVPEGTVDTDKRHWTREDVRVWRNFLSPQKEMVLSSQEIEERMLEFYSEFISKEKIALAA